MHELLDFVLSFLLNLDAELEKCVQLYGVWVYALLFLIVFAETGLVVTPFLPGDSLLFTAGALAAVNVLDVRLVVPLLLAAAILGDAVNYAVGHFVGPRVFRAEGDRSFWQRLLNRKHLQQAHEFFERYGGKAVVLGRFVPIVRTFVPFVAGAGSMSYPQFAFYNVMGGILWVGLCCGAGYAFGNVPIVKHNFELVVVGIVFVSLLPIVWSFLISRLNRSPATPAAPTAIEGEIK
ncbi:MAG: DedA family protein [Pirellulales bacterium]